LGVVPPGLIRQWNQMLTSQIHFLTHFRPVAKESALWTTGFSGLFSFAKGAFNMTDPRKSNGSKSNAGPEFGDLPDRLKDLGNRIAAEKVERAEAAKPTTTYQGASDYSKGYKLASEFVAGTLVGGLIGYGLDYVAGTLPLFLIVFLLLGFGAGILNMSRAANRSQPTPEELSKMPKPSADDEEED
jgi:ATP synthase protein I